MITGANTNVRHRGVVYHVQTEDSGLANPRIISHLYHGGTILASEKTDYGDKVDQENLEAVVRGLIEAQHKQMLDRLKQGDFDAAIAERLGDVTDDGLEETESDAPTPQPPPAAAKRERPSEKVAARPAPRADRAFGEGSRPPTPSTTSRTPPNGRAPAPPTAPNLRRGKPARAGEARRSVAGQGALRPG